MAQWLARLAVIQLPGGSRFESWWWSCFFSLFSTRVQFTWFIHSFLCLLLDSIFLDLLAFATGRIYLLFCPRIKRVHVTLDELLPLARSAQVLPPYLRAGGLLSAKFGLACEILA
jgi:hypothetical protein